MKWINFLHLYQPANTNAYHISEATEKSYKRLIRAIEDHPDMKITMNISGSLLHRWQDLGYEKLFDKVSKLIKNGQIELVGTAAYHPLMPLVPEKEIVLQIKEHEQLVEEKLGKGIKLKGFFLPEMAYSLSTAKIIKKLGYEWIIIDSFASGDVNIDTDKVYQDQAGLKVVFRSRKFSNSYPPDTVLSQIKLGDEQTIITATDAEIYGLRHEDPSAEFEKCLKHENVETVTISQFISSHKEIKKIKIVESSWESNEKELKDGMPYAIWHNRNNKIQMKIWQLADIALSASHKLSKDKNHYWSRWHLVRGLASCTLWWASGKDFSQVFGPIAWSPDEIEKGLNELIRSIRSLESLKKEDKINAEKLLAEIKLLIWKTHWQKYGK